MQSIHLVPLSVIKSRGPIKQVISYTCIYFLSTIKLERKQKIEPSASAPTLGFTPTHTQRRGRAHVRSRKPSLGFGPRTQSSNAFFSVVKITLRIDGDFFILFSHFFSFFFLFSALLSALSSEGSGYVLSSFNFNLFLTLN